jgi:hypothetical protein
MFDFLDPATADLLFTITSTLGLLIAGAATIVALPWADDEIAATERAAMALVTPQPPSRARAVR